MKRIHWAVTFTCFTCLLFILPAAKISGAVRRDGNAFLPFLTANDTATGKLKFPEPLLPPEKEEELSADILAARGRHYEERADYARAYNAYTQAYGADSTRTGLPLPRARMAEREGDPALVRTLLGELLEKEKGNFPGNFMLANLDFAAEAYRPALERFRFLLATDTVNRALLERIGDCYLKMERADSALAYYTRLAALNPRNVNVARKRIGILAADLMNRPRCMEALGLCDRALGYSPGNRAILRSKGAILFNLNMVAEARETYEELLAAGDSTVTNLMTLGIIGNMEKNYPRSIELLERAMRIDSTDIGVLLTLASSYGAVLRTQEALRLADMAEFTMSPTTMTILRCRGDIYRDAGERRTAARNYYAAWELFPMRIDLLSEIIALYPASGDENRQIVLFGLIHYLENAVSLKIDIRKIGAFGKLMQSYKEDFFYAGKDYLIMATPTGKKSRLSRQRFDRLMRYYE